MKKKLRRAKRKIKALVRLLFVSQWVLITDDKSVKHVNYDINMPSAKARKHCAASVIYCNMDIEAQESVDLVNEMINTSH